ncbi:hypothetical protein B0H19DRAFT_1073206 [Mycena capillaripes]|nr:hypothetical protein B0H19DRAFT_1073206 [Mycena capillaripes]
MFHSRSPLNENDASDDDTAKARVCCARNAFIEARGRYYAGEAGPFDLNGRWSEATYETLVTTLENHWRLGWTDGVITIYGDTGKFHALVTQYIVGGFDRVESSAGTSSFSVPFNLFRDFRSTTQRWRLSPTKVFFKEPECFLRAATSETSAGENGLVVEVAHLNEDFTTLAREIVDRTRGKGQRALVAVGIKIDTKSPLDQRDPRLRMIVRDVSPTSNSINCRIYEFGRDSNVIPRATPVQGPPTPVTVRSTQPVEGCCLESVTPTDTGASPPG